MADQYTLLDLRTQARQQSDFPGSGENGFIKDSELTQYLNNGLSALTDLLVLSQGDYYVSRSTFSTVANSGSYSLSTVAPSFYKLRLVELDLGGGNFTPIMRFNLNEQMTANGSLVTSYMGVPTFRYREMGDALWLDPYPQSGQTVRLTYTPCFQKLVADTDTFDGVSGWAEYAVVYAAIACKQKAEQDVGILAGKLAQLERRVTTMAPQRDHGTPKRMQLAQDSYESYRRFRRWVP